MARILHISVTAGADPTGAIALRLARHAVSTGHDVHIAYGRGPAPDHIPATRIASAVDLALHGAATQLTDRHALVPSPSSLRLHRLLDRFRPDIIHLHNIHGYYLSLPALCRMIADRNIPTVLTLHDAWPLTGHCATPESCRGFTGGCQEHCPLRRSYPYSLISRTAANFRKKKQSFGMIPELHIVAPSEYMLGICRQSHLSARSTHLIYHGIDTGRFTPGSVKKSPILLAVSRRWTEAKGIYDLIELRRHIPEEYTIVAAGEPPAFRVTLPGLSFIGPVGPDRLIDLYRQATVMINTTHGESFSLVKAEALACGTPVASYEAGAAGELLAPPYGISVPTGDIITLARAATTLACTNTSPQDLHKFASRHFGLPRMLDEYAHLYSTLLTQ